MSKNKGQHLKKFNTLITCFKCKKEGHHVRNCSSNQEVKDISKDQEKKKRIPHVKCSKMEHYTSMCFNKNDDQVTLPKKKIRRSNRKCYRCHEVGHEIVSCPNMNDEIFMSSKKRHIGKEVNKMQGGKASCKDKNQICYTCRKKGHICKNCPMGNIAKPILFSDHYLLRKARSSTIFSNVVSSQNVNVKAIWMPKSLVTNIEGPKMVWVPKSA